MKYMYTIYVLKDPITKDVRYVGQTKGEASFRFQQHLKEDSPNSLKCRWVKELSLNGLQPELETVLEIADKSQANYAEHVLITYYLSNSKSGILNKQNVSKVPPYNYDKACRLDIQKSLDWVKCNRGFVKIRLIEQDLEMPEGTLNKFIKGRSLAPQWGFKIAEWVKNFKK